MLAGGSRPKPFGNGNKISEPGVMMMILEHSKYNTRITKGFFSSSYALIDSLARTSSCSLKTNFV